MGANASSAALLQLATDIPDDADRDTILRMARERFPNADVAAMLPHYEAFKAEQAEVAIVHRLGRQSVRDITVVGARVLIRADLDVPLDPVDSTMLDAAKVDAVAPTINDLLDRGARSVVIAASLGDPRGNFHRMLSLAGQVHQALERALGRHVVMLKGLIGHDVLMACLEPLEGTVFLLDNLRFHPEEEGEGVNLETLQPTRAHPRAVANFRDDLGSIGDVYVNDAFALAHRGDSSIAGITIPRRVAGLQMARELKYFSKALESPERPLVAMFGGTSAVGGKASALLHLLDKVDDVIIGGALAVTFLHVLHGMPAGASAVDDSAAEAVEAIMKKAASRGVHVRLPTDLVTADTVSDGAAVGVTDVSVGIKDGLHGLDVGPVSARAFAEVVGHARTLLWYGPLGMFELDKFAQGTKTVLSAVTRATRDGCVSIVNGAATAACVDKFASPASVSHVSSGSAATLQLLQGKALPGVSTLLLSDAARREGVEHDDEQKAASATKAQRPE